MSIPPLWTFLLVIVVAFLGAWLAHFFSKRRQRKDDFNKAAETFHAAFVDTINLLRQDLIVDLRMPFQIITVETLDDQEKAKIIFEPFLDRSSLEGFNNAWKEYERCPITYCTKTKSEERQYCLDHIEKLLSYAARKV